MKLITAYQNGGAIPAFSKHCIGTQKTFYRLHMEPVLEDAQEFSQERDKLIQDSKENPENELKNGEEIKKMLNRELPKNFDEPMKLSEMPLALPVEIEDGLMAMGFVTNDVTPKD